MSMFYPCKHCNRKYKTPDKVLAHMSKAHGVENPEVPQQIEHVSNRNGPQLSPEERERRKVENQRKREERQRAKLEERRQLEELARQASEGQRQLQLEKERLEQEKAQVSEQKERWRNAVEQVSSERKEVSTSEALEIKECQVCWDAEPNTAFVPCGHAVTCRECANTIVRTQGTCPMCRQRTNSVLRIYA